MLFTGYAGRLLLRGLVPVSSAPAPPDYPLYASLAFYLAPYSELPSDSFPCLSSPCLALYTQLDSYARSSHNFKVRLFKRFKRTPALSKSRVVDAKRAPRALSSEELKS
eukprot:4232535-Pleurochrysis_carterae.AAC.1